MITMAVNKKENNTYNPHPIFNHTINALDRTANQFVVPWQLADATKKGKDARQLNINFGMHQTNRFD